MLHTEKCSIAKINREENIICNQFKHLEKEHSTYTQTKKKRPIFMVLYLSIQLRCRNKNKTKMFIKRLTHKTR